MRTTDLYFYCDKGSNSAPYDKSKLNCNEEESCVYKFEIYSQYACADRGGSSSNSGGLSGGSIFLILVFSLFAAYWVFGFVICGFLNGKDYADLKGSCPHCSFWTAFPALVAAGCTVTKEFIMQKAGKGQEQQSLMDAE